MKKRLIKMAAIVLSILMLSSLIAGCGKKEPASTNDGTSSSELKPVTLKFYFIRAKQKSADEVWAKISEYTKDKLNVKFDMNWIPDADYAQKILVMAASGDTYDANFDGDWLVFPQMLNKGAYLPLNDLLPKYAPDLYKKYQETGGLTSATIGGKIMSLPWTMSMNQRPWFNWRADIAETKGLKWENDSIKTIEEMDKVLTDLRQAFPDKKIVDVAADDGFRIKYELCNLSNYYVFGLNDASCKVIPYEQTDAYREKATYAKKWQDAGIIWKDVLQDANNVKNLRTDGTLLCNSGSTHEWSLMTQNYSDKNARLGHSALYPEKKFANRTALANMIAINKNSKNPDRVLMFLNMLETDQKLYDMVLYGIEGKTYEIKDGQAVLPAGEDPANPSYMNFGGEWAFWKPQFMRGSNAYPKGFWEAEAEYAKQPGNMPSPLDGFFFDPSNVKNEIAQRTQIFTDADKLIRAGLVDNAEKAVNDLIEKQKAAGVDKITAEMQKQVDAFLAAKK